MTPEQIKEARQLLGLTQIELASKMGIKLAKLRNWEQGRNSASDEGATLIRLLVDRFKLFGSAIDNGENHSTNKGVINGQASRDQQKHGGVSRHAGV